MSDDIVLYTALAGLLVVVVWYFWRLVPFPLCWCPRLTFAARGSSSR
jgi:hypothetical protein